MRIRGVVKKVVFASPFLKRMYVGFRTLQNKSLYQPLCDDYFNDEPVPIQLFNGNVMYIYESDEKGVMYKDDKARADILNGIWIKYVKDANVVLDIGANYGQFVLFLDPSELQQDVKMYLFEPNPKVSAALRLSLDNNEVGKYCEILPIAAYSHREEMTFHINVVTSGSSSLFKKDAISVHHGTFVKAIPVQADTLDNVITEKKLQVGGRIAIKIDVEGADFDAVFGCKNLIANTSELLIIMETRREHADMLNQEQREFMSTLFDRFNSYVTYSNQILPVSGFDEYMNHFSKAIGCIDLVFSDIAIHDWK